jgi:hypothetical protein
LAAVVVAVAPAALAVFLSEKMRISLAAAAVAVAEQAQQTQLAVPEAPALQGQARLGVRVHLAALVRVALALPTLSVAALGLVERADRGALAVRRALPITTHQTGALAVLAAALSLVIATSHTSPQALALAQFHKGIL